DTGLQEESGRMGDIDIRGFFASVIESGSNDLRDLIVNNTANDFDIIYVNWDNGTDDLRRNAFVLQAVIDWVNDNKTGNTPNVVLGQSMGGVIARYALRDMENRNEDHDTSLYISHDAPHQGAHIPLGALYFARQMLNEVIATPVGNVGVAVTTGEFSVGDIRDLLEAPAVKQLLRQYVRKDYVNDNTVHDSWQAELRSKGYPQQTRNVALSNASHCAEGYGLSSNQQLFRVNGSGSTKGLQDILFGMLGGLFSGIAVGDIATALLGILPGNSKLDADFRVSAYPSSGTANIYSGRITYTKKLLWVINITRTFTRRNFNSPSGVLLQDNFPGGSNLFINQLSSDSGAGGNFFGNFGYNFDAVDNVNFITAVSALDVGGGSTTLNTSDYTRTYTQGNRPSGSRAIPFVNFTTSFNSNSENEIHLSFNSRNGDWLADELNNGASTFDCGFACSSLAMSGPSDFCSSATFSVPAPNSAVTWSVTPSNSLGFQQNRASSGFSRIGSFEGNVTITANISGASCDVPNRSISKQVYVGRSRPLAGTLPSLCADGALVGKPYTVPVSTGADSYRLTSNAPFPIFDFQNQVTFTSAPRTVNLIPFQAGTYNITLAVTNTCGTRSFTYPITITSCGGGGFFFSVYPNPSNNGTFYVGEKAVGNNGTFSAQTGGNGSASYNIGKESVANPEKYSFEVYDRYGKILFQKRDQKWNGLMELDLERYGKGLFFIRILGKDTEETHRVLLDRG
ncbi:MAG: hypothetical protein AAGJ12_00535, partial [Bacteroidota bacterium]